MPVPAILGAAAPIVGGLVGKAIGGGGPKNAQPALPKDLQGLRGNNIGLLQYLLGFNQPGMGQQQGLPQQQQPQGGQGGTLGQPNGPGNGWGVNPGGQYGQAVPQGGWGNAWGATPGASGGYGQQPGMGGTMGGMGMGGILQALQGGLGGHHGGLQGLSMSAQHPGGMSQGMPMSAGGFNPQGMRGVGNDAMNFNPAGMGLVGGGGGLPIQMSGGAGGNTQGQGMPMQGGGFNPQWMASRDGMPGGPAAGSPGAGMLGRMESYFGPLGTPTTALQQQSLGGISQFLNSNPYQQSNQALQGILGGNGGFGGSNSMYGNAAKGFGDVKNANYFGDAKSMFQGAGAMNPFGAAQHSLEGMLGANPGQGMLDALRPQFERNLAAANQQGGRFGSSNAILNSRAVDDYNLLGSQALQRGIDQQIAAAGQYGVLGNNLINARLGAGQGLLGVGQGQLSQGLGAAQGLSGVAGGMGQNASSLMQGRLGAAQGLANNQNSLFGNMAGAYGIGSAQAGQEAQRQQQALQILLGQLGVAQGATLGVNNVVSPTGAQQGAQIGGGIGQLLAAYGQGGGGIPGAPGGLDMGTLGQQAGQAPSFYDLVNGRGRGTAL